MIRSACISLSIIACSTSSLAAADTLSAAQAETIIDGCQAFAEENHRIHGIAVYDSSANLLAFLRMDGASVGAAAFAMDKAKAVAMWRFPTSGMEEAVQGTPGFANAPGVVTVAGGVPVFTADGQSFLGSVATSGEPPLQDVECAEAGIAAAGLSATRQ
ncbi:MAG: heme-binding protein [Pseudomonadota bacterium]